jgi:predicted phage baseplate assembly protein
VALASPQLDDLTWSELVDGARRRIAAVSRGLWTLHAPVDPGVTLVELFAYLLDQRSYMLDQVPPSFVRATLALMGEATQPARAAGVALVLDAGGWTIVPRRTKLRVDRRGGGAVFATRAALSLLPVRSVTVEVDGKDRGADLARRRLVPLVAAGAPTTIVLTLAGPPPPRAPDDPPASLLLSIVAPALAPSWSPDAPSDVPPPAAVTWSYVTKDGARAPLTGVIDGTGGLRRAGIVRFDVPDGLAVDEAGTWRARIGVDVDAFTFSAPPVVTSIEANAVAATHATWVVSRQGPDWLPLPGRTLTLPTDEGLPLERRVVVRLRELDGAWRRWFEVDDLLPRGPGDRVFTLDRARGVVTFGDGLHGKIPRLDAAAPAATIVYQVGGGEAGNVGASPWVGVDDALTAESLDAAVGGAESETPDEARLRVGAGLSERTRAVTRDDFESIARETPGVGVRRAHAQIGLDPAHPCVALPGATTVFIVPDLPARTDDDVAAGRGPADPEPDPGALAAVRARFAETRLVASQVYVRGPLYRDVSIVVSAAGDPHDPAAVRARVLGAVRRWLDPLVGGDDGAGWPFGAALEPTAILRVAQDALGGDALVTGLALGLDGAPPAPACAALDIEPWALVRALSLDLRLAAAAAQGDIG